MDYYKRWDKLPLLESEDDDEVFAILQFAKSQADTSFSFQNSEIDIDDDLPNFYDELSRRSFAFASYSRQSTESKEAFELGVSCSLNSMAIRIQLKQFKNVIDISDLLISLLIENGEDNMDIDMPLFRARYFQFFARLQWMDSGSVARFTRDLLELHAIRRRRHCHSTPSALRMEFENMFTTLLDEMKRKKVSISLHAVVDSGMLTNEELLHFAFMVIINKNEKDTKENAIKICQRLEHISEWDTLHSFLAHYVQGNVCTWMGNYAQVITQVFVVLIIPTYIYIVILINMSLIDVTTGNTRVFQVGYIIKQFNGFAAKGEMGALGSMYSIVILSRCVVILFVYKKSGICRYSTW